MLSTIAPGIVYLPHPCARLWRIFKNLFVRDINPCIVKEPLSKSEVPVLFRVL